MRRPVSGVWGMPKEMVATLLGYEDVEKNRGEAREIMRSKGFGPDNRMKLKVITRNIPSFRNPTVIFLNQLSHIYIDAELDLIETSIYHTAVFLKKFEVGINNTGKSLYDADQHRYETYSGGSLPHSSGYTNPEMYK